ncbi:RidA family protein [Streptomyces sp. AD681]|uniref:RidA family protein n=1 Tax=Streptomyces sp. AD681 TaxID=3019069 RepID=UPI0022F1505D|nr:RidA family protein [Streptomyces sp. AD681]MDA5146078.1 RidA family protein [Streptomyces sp. AD681]
MTSAIEKHLTELGVPLPEPARSVANYLPYTRSGNLLRTSGQLPLRDGALVATGLLGQNLDVPTGQLAARWCAANVLAQAKSALGDLSRIQQLLKITVFVAGIPEFNEHHLVANGASDLFVEVLGEAGEHARSAVGVAALPMRAPVEIEAVIACA